GLIEPREQAPQRRMKICLIGRRKADVVNLGTPWRAGFVDGEAGLNRNGAQLVLVGRVQPGTAEFDRKPPWIPPRPSTSPQRTARFEDPDRRARRGEPPRGAQSGSAGADDDDVRIRHGCQAVRNTVGFPSIRGSKAVVFTVLCSSPPTRSGRRAAISPNNQP